MWVEREIPAGAYASVQHPAREPLEQQSPDPAVTPILERKLHQVVDGCNSLITLEGRKHEVVASAEARRVPLPPAFKTARGVRQGNHSYLVSRSTTIFAPSLTRISS